MREISLYFHIPFCKSKCIYCDFVSYCNKKKNHKEYFEGINSEIDLYKDLHDSYVSTIFFGGGTPSFVDSKYIGQVLDKCRQRFEFSNDIEITIECNPESITREKLCDYKSYGINRLSIGLQTTKKHLLEALGRIHTKEQFLEAYKISRECGFDNINIDLMFGLDKQKLVDWEDTLNEILELNPEHISCYSLSIEEGTRLYEEYILGTLNLPCDDINREMYYKAKEMLCVNGYDRYEISNFSRKGFKCRHNLIYWTYKEYIGFGVSAHSFFENKRVANCIEVDKYIDLINSKQFAYIDNNIISKNEQISEYIITRFRLSMGINKEDFFNKFNVNIYKLYGEELNNFIDMYLLVDDGTFIFLTDRGIDISNSILCQFV